jgi:hypothetical protein
VEGQIKRLKILKRQLFGRARLDLLSCRFMRAPRGGPVQARAQCAPAPAHAEIKAAEPHGPDCGGGCGLHREESRSTSRQRVWCRTPRGGERRGGVHAWAALMVGSACLPYIHGTEYPRASPYITKMGPEPNLSGKAHGHTGFSAERVVEVAVRGVQR